MKDRSTVGSLTVIQSHQIVQAESTWIGSPAVLCGITRSNDKEQAQYMQSIVHGAAMANKQLVAKARPWLAALGMIIIPWFGVMYVALSTAGIYLSAQYLSSKWSCSSNCACNLGVWLLSAFVLLFFELALTVLLKWCFFPKFQGRSELWSIKFMGWNCFGSIMRILGHTILHLFEGTALMPVWLRMLGARMGTGCYFDTKPPAETDCLEIGDSCTILPSMQCFVPHTIDRAHLQFAPIKLGDACSIGVGSCMLPFSHLKCGVRLGPLSLVLKGEVVPAGVYAAGNPIKTFQDPPSTDYAISASKQISWWRILCCCLMRQMQVGIEEDEIGRMAKVRNSCSDDEEDDCAPLLNASSDRQTPSPGRSVYGTSPIRF